ncbi:hypothetical protein Agub_g40, partial [Astrephomene gubernaculifera]
GEVGAGEEDCEWAPPLLPYLAPMRLPRGGWPEWARRVMGPQLRLPVTSTTLGAYEASQLSQTELRAFVQLASVQEAAHHPRKKRRMQYRNIAQAMSKQAWRSWKQQVRAAAAAAGPAAGGQDPPAAAGAAAATG